MLCLGGENGPVLWREGMWRLPGIRTGESLYFPFFGGLLAVIQKNLLARANPAAPARTGPRLRLAPALTGFSASAGPSTLTEAPGMLSVPKSHHTRE